MTLLFVYGTLKRGGSNHRFLADQQFVSVAQTQPGYRLYNVGGYPGLVVAPDEFVGITGEVWRVAPACLERLDEFEGVGEGLYRRERVPLQAPFEFQSVDAYYYAREVMDHPIIGNAWPT